MEATLPPAYGLEAVCKLSGYFLDHHELQTVEIYSKQAVEELRHKKTISQVEEKFGVLRVLAIIGESTKYLTNSTKNSDPSIPWKNIEKIRDLLSHVSRLPMRQAVNLVLELKDPPHIARLLDEVRSQINQQSQEKPVVPSKKKNKNQLEGSKELLKYRLYPSLLSFFLLATLSSVLSTSLSNWIWMLLPLLVFGVLIGLEWTTNWLWFLPPWFLKLFFMQKLKSARDTWGTIPSPPSKPEQLPGLQIPEIAEVQENVG